MRRVLVTGGAGYIGSHTCKKLASIGLEVIVFDNLSTGHKEFVRWGPLVRGDLRERDRVIRALKTHKPDAVVHFAAASLVGESVRDPAFYVSNNVVGTLHLLEAMREAGVDNIIVSSTCAVYGIPERMPITEYTPVAPLNPYGHSKLFMEGMCRDFAAAHGLRWVALRYFNASGADPEGDVGEKHNPETHLIPRTLMAADQLIEHLEIFGDDFETTDGTCERDYIHVNDLAQAHITAAYYLNNGGESDVFNLGTGVSYSVRQVIEAAARITGNHVPHRIVARRTGDPPRLLADPSKANRVLNWTATQSSLGEILSTAWAWHLKTKNALTN